MKLDKDQLAAMARVNEGRSVFLTGPAGTGKSSVTTEIIRRRLDDRSLKVCATTGVAALNLRDKLAAEFGAHVDTATVYRWAGIGIGPKPGQSFGDYYEWMSKRGYSWQGTCKRIRGTRTLIVDEISMLPGRTLEFINFVCRNIRNSDLPFGGIQVIAVGDFLQLPPVSKSGTYDWAFNSHVWHDADFSCVSLRTLHRQSEDVAFANLLNEFRTGRVSNETARTLRKKVALFPDRNTLRLLTHNTQVNKWNGYQLECIDGAEMAFTADGDGPTDEVAWLQKNLVTPTVLRLREGARVMVTANLPGDDGELKAANGDMGVVRAMPEESGGAILVELDSGMMLAVERKTWTFDPTSEVETGWFKQYPLRLAWAATIHKSQGLTLDRALVDIRAAREPGQAYVALSRVRSLDGLQLKDMFKGVWVSDDAKKFHRAIERGEKPEENKEKLKLTT